MVGSIVANSLFIVAHIVLLVFCAWSLFCCAVPIVSFLVFFIFSLGKRELVSLLLLSFDVVI